MADLSASALKNYRKMKMAAEGGGQPAASPSVSAGNVSAPSTRTMPTQDMRMEGVMQNQKGRPMFASLHTPPPFPSSTTQGKLKPPQVPSAPKVPKPTIPTMR